MTSDSVTLSRFAVDLIRRLDEVDEETIIGEHSSIKKIELILAAFGGVVELTEQRMLKGEMTKKEPEPEELPDQ